MLRQKKTISFFNIYTRHVPNYLCFFDVRKKLHIIKKTFTAELAEKIEQSGIHYWSLAWSQINTHLLALH